jgi:CDP-diacylglycerol--glycerol-3-phosphate 3-phosphatidyltransferase
MQTPIKEKLRSLLEPSVRVLARMGFPPVLVTFVGLFLSVLGAWAVAGGHLFRGGLILLLAGICDAMDGLLARSLGKVTRFGAFLDSTVDRIAEAAIYVGIVLYFLIDPYETNRTVIFFTVAALAGSFLTSYARARAEGLGLECRVGLLERTERLTLLIAALILGFLGDFILVGVLFVLAVLTWATAVQRMIHVRGETAGSGGELGGPEGPDREPVGPAMEPGPHSMDPRRPAGEGRRGDGEERPIS